VLAFSALAEANLSLSCACFAFSLFICHFCETLTQVND